MLFINETPPEKHIYNMVRIKLNCLKISGAVSLVWQIVWRPVAIYLSRFFSPSNQQQKMNVFDTVKTSFILVGIYPSQRFKKPYDQIVKTATFSFYLVSLGIIVSCSAAYAYENFTDSFQALNVILAFMVIFGCVGNVGPYIGIFINKTKFDDLVLEFQRIVEKGRRIKQFRFRPTSSIIFIYT